MTTKIIHGTTSDKRGWTRFETAGMPRATNAYWTDDRPVASEYRFIDQHTNRNALPVGFNGTWQDIEREDAKG
jgi:hypothetical protein